MMVFLSLKYSWIKLSCLELANVKEKSQDKLIDLFGINVR